MAGKLKITLSASRVGRAGLHLGCLLRGGNWSWHMAGVRRELQPWLKWLVPALALAAFFLPPWEASAAAPYREPFRPQFHFTPQRNWMNDPNGMVFYEGEYHLFFQYNPFGDKWGHMSWGHAVSPDLVHWQELPVALAEEDGIMIFSGSAVVDWKNTSGFGRDGRPPLVAIYTGRRNSDDRQSQCLAFSNDKGRTWTKYSGNPVLDIGSNNFRDPKVFWHEPTKGWVMVVAMAADRKIRFYGSRDLKEWTLLSEFGPAGAVKGVWECPDLFPLPVSGEKEQRWVLIVNIGSGSVAGGSGTQYFIGEFNGRTFTLEPGTIPSPLEMKEPQGRVLADFEGATYGDWTATGEAFGPGPAKGTLPNQNPVAGFRGQGLVNSFLQGDQTQGTLTSPEFEVSANYLNFLIGGGAHRDKTCMNLLVDRKVVRTATGSDQEALDWASWDVQEFRGRKAQLQIVDAESGGWGHINVDRILLSDQPAKPKVEHALWADYGRDFYAGVSWSDVPARDGRRIWLGWMSNWEYAQDVPTSPWRSAMSVARELALIRTSEGLRLSQQPVREMEKLRGKRHRFKGGTITDLNQWLRKAQVRGNTLELELELSSSNRGHCGLSLLKGDNAETRVAVDFGKRVVLLDRTRSGNVGFHPRFSGTHEAPLLGKGTVHLRILVDACSVEVFADRGAAVITDLVFPPEGARGLEAFGSTGDCEVRSLDIWELKSAWK